MLWGNLKERVWRGSGTVPGPVICTIAQRAGIFEGAGSRDNALPPVPRNAQMFWGWERRRRGRGPLQGTSP